MPVNSALTLLFLLLVFQFSARTRTHLFHKLLSEHKALLDESARNKAQLASSGMCPPFLALASLTFGSESHPFFLFYSLPQAVNAEKELRGLLEKLLPVESELNSGSLLTPCFVSGC